MPEARFVVLISLGRGFSPSPEYTVTAAPGPFGFRLPPRPPAAHELASCYDSVSATTDAASAISLLSKSASFLKRFDMIATAMGARPGGHTTAMSSRAP